jgi:GTP cyclohydrolase I
MSDALTEATQRFVDALGVPPDRELDGTPERVAELWRTTLLSGYDRTPAQVLTETIPDTSGATIVLTDIPFHCVCPHHLLPAVGHAHVAFVPDGRIVGFGQIETLVQVCARRLVLQEALTAHIADALMEHLGAQGAACAMSAQHLCLSLRGREPRSTRIYTHVARGCLLGRDVLPGAGR